VGIHSKQRGGTTCGTRSGLTTPNPVADRSSTAPTQLKQLLPTALTMTMPYSPPPPLTAAAAAADCCLLVHLGVSDGQHRYPVPDTRYPNPRCIGPLRLACYVVRLLDQVEQHYLVSQRRGTPYAGLLQRGHSPQ